MMNTANLMRDSNFQITTFQIFKLLKINPHPFPLTLLILLKIEFV